MRADGTNCSADSSRRCSVCTTCATRWRRLRVGSVRRAVAVGARRGAASVQGHQAPARDGRRRRRRHGARRLRASSDRGARDACRRCAPGYPDRRVWAVFEPRSASSCRRVFQDDFARAFGAADEVILAGRVPIEPAGGRAPSARRSSSTISRRAGSTPVTSRTIDDIVETDRRRASPRRRRRADVERRFWRHSRQAPEALNDRHAPRIREAGDSALLHRAGMTRSIQRSMRGRLRQRRQFAARVSLACAMWSRPIDRLRCSSIR